MENDVRYPVTLPTVVQQKTENIGHGQNSDCKIRNENAEQEKSQCEILRLKHLLKK